MADERSGSFGLCTLGYSSSGWGHWPLIDAGSLSGMLNSYWPSAHPGSLGRLSGALNSHWLSGGSSFSGTSWDVVRGITRIHRGITVIHSGTARRRRRRIINPIHAALEKGLGDRGVFLLCGSLPFRSGVVVSLRPLSVCHSS